MEKIDSFNGEYYFLSNYYHSPIVFEGIHYPTVEHAFQAAKTLNNNKRLEIARMRTPGDAKKAGRTVSLRPDWEKIKFDVMKKCVTSKFEDYNLRNKLLATGDAELIEGNWWNDTTWGVCNGVGQNHLGKILMEVRDEIRRNKNY